MNRTLLAAACVVALSHGSAYAQHHGGGGGGGGFGGALLGGAIGGVVGGLLVQPRPPPPPPVYYAAPPPVIYVAPRTVYVAPAPHLTFHPWPGPGFACYEPEPNAVNRAICGSEDLSASSLALVQTVYAAIQQTPYNAAGLRAEYASFQQSERANCSVYAPSQQGDCIAGMLAHEHDVIMGRLSGVYADEASRPITVSLQVQQRLHAMGLLPGSADGVYGDGTRRAIASWQTGQGHPQTGVLTNDEVALLVPTYNAPVPAYTAPPSAAITRNQPPDIPTLQSGTANPVAQSASAAPAWGAGPVNPVAAVLAGTPTPTAPPAPEPTPTPAATAPTDPMNGVRENMPYALARPKLLAAGWQTQFFSIASVSDPDRELRQWFIDHHITEVEDCSSSGCKLQFHNTDGRLLYVYTQPGSHASDAFRGAGPSVIAWCLDVDDITCPAPAAPTVSVSQQANK